MARRSPDRTPTPAPPEVTIGRDDLLAAIDAAAATVDDTTDSDAAAVIASRLARARDAVERAGDLPAATLAAGTAAPDGDPALIADALAIAAALARARRLSIPLREAAAHLRTALDARSGTYANRR